MKRQTRRVSEAERAMTIKELIELVKDPRLVTELLLESDSPEPQVAPAGPEDKLDWAYLRRRLLLVQRRRAQQRQERSA